MPDPQWQQFVSLLKASGVPFDEELADAEVARVESNFGFRFPPDLRAFLQTALPTGEGFPNWRSEPEASLRQRFDLPLEGILFDVEHNEFWLPEWGTKPADLDGAKRVVRALVTDAPVLIPVYYHRMMPDRPRERAIPCFPFIRPTSSIMAPICAIT